MSQPAPGPRLQMTLAAAELFRERGYDGTGLREVVERAGAARGAIYHHFPGGKAELATTVVDAVGGRMADLVEQVCARSTPTEAVDSLMDYIEKVLVGDGSVGRSGCPVAAVALAAEDDDGALRAAAHAVFQRIRTAIADCLRRDGIGAGTAEEFATMAVASAEGVIILARAARDPAAVRTVRRSLQWTLQQLGPQGARS